MGSWPNPLYLLIEQEFSDTPLLGLSFSKPGPGIKTRYVAYVPTIADGETSDGLKVYFCSWYGERPGLSKVTGSSTWPVFSPPPEIVKLYTLPIMECAPSRVSFKDVTKMFDRDLISQAQSNVLLQQVKHINDMADQIEFTVPTTKPVAKAAPPPTPPPQAPTVKQDTPVLKLRPRLVQEAPKTPNLVSQSPTTDSVENQNSIKGKLKKWFGK